jgi:hypothetical protein
MTYYFNVWPLLGDRRGLFELFCASLGTANIISFYSDPRSAIVYLFVGWIFFCASGANIGWKV